MNFRKKYIIIIIFILSALIGMDFCNLYAEIQQQSEKFILRRAFNQVLSQITRMPITLFPGKTQNQLVRLRLGFKKYYFQKPYLGKIELIEPASAKIYLSRFFVKHFPFKSAFFYVQGLKIEKNKVSYDRLLFESFDFYTILTNYFSIIRLNCFINQF
jgi:hypothetical protein